ncbi:hypothetical protein Tco_1407811, partial [Tanacetum coccineum]
SISLTNKGTITVKAFIASAEDELAVGKTDTRFRQWVEITMKKDENSPSETTHDVTSDTKSVNDKHEPLPPLPKLLGAEPIGTLNDVITSTEVTQTSTVSDKTKPVTKK